jgi:threonyl-tRNA synthetase
MKPNLEIKRHSLEHVMVLAVRRLFDKDVKLGVGPVIENGFYQDFDRQFSEEDFGKIEGEMKKIFNEDLKVEREEIDIDEAIAFFKKGGQKYKVELLEDIKAKGSSKMNDQKEAETVDALTKSGKVSMYTIGIHRDLCRGPHVGSTGELKDMAFKLDRVAGAYWRGNEKNKMLTRIYAVAFEDKKELDKHYEMQAMAKERDHRKIGKEMDLFTFSELVGSGLPLFTPRGTILREELNNYAQALRKQRGYKKVWSPHITKNDLYKTSGHWDKFGAELFLVKSQETTDELVMKPMNCPHHQQIYASRPHSYKEFPIRYMETTTNYRDEKAGELLGLSRVRSLTQDDTHVFCTPDQIGDIYKELIEIVQEFYGKLGMKLRARLSYRDPKQPEKYLGEEGLWKLAQKTIRKMAESHNLNFFEAEGEAAFYGPKIDFMMEDALGREWQVGTIQLDFVQPARFKLVYTDHEGKDQTPVMVHFALMGSIERFLSVYIEHTGGHFPLWVNPTQVAIIPISDEQIDYAKKVAEKLQASVEDARVELFFENESMQNKIRKAQHDKVPYMLVVGGREEEAGTVNIRLNNGEKLGEMKLDEFVARFAEKVADKSLDL